MGGRGREPWGSPWVWVGAGGHAWGRVPGPKALAAVSARLRAQAALEMKTPRADKLLPSNAEQSRLPASEVLPV